MTTYIGNAWEWITGYWRRWANYPGTGDKNPYRLDVRDINAKLASLCSTSLERGLMSDWVDYIAEGNTQGNSGQYVARWKVLLKDESLSRYFYRPNDVLHLSYRVGGDVYVWEVVVSVSNEINFSDTELLYPIAPSNLVYSTLLEAGVTIKRIGNASKDWMQAINGANILPLTIPSGSHAPASLIEADYGVGSVPREAIQLTAIDTPQIEDEAIGNPQVDSDFRYPCYVDFAFDANGVLTGDYAIKNGKQDEDAYVVGNDGQISKLGVKWSSVPAADTEVEIYLNGLATGLSVLSDGVLEYVESNPLTILTVHAGDTINLKITENIEQDPVGNDHRCFVLLVIGNGNILSP